MLAHKDCQGIIVVVTGACGFLGCRLVQMLVETGGLGGCMKKIAEESYNKHGNFAGQAMAETKDFGEFDGWQVSEVRAFDRVINEHVEGMGSASVKVSCVQGDVRDMPVLRDALRDATVVLHAASLVDVWGKYPSTALHSTNVIGTKNVVEACRLENVPCLIYTSTMEVVGPNILGDPFIRGNEDTSYRTMHSLPYTMSKARAELIVLEANGTQLSGGGHLATLALRPTGIYGEDHDILKGVMISVHRCRGVMPMIAPPEAEQGRVYIGNVAWMHILAAYCLYTKPTGPAAGEVFYCYDDSPYLSYSNFNHLLLEAAGLRTTPFQPPYFVILIIVWIAEVVSGMLRPFKRWTPILNRHTLGMVRTPFTVSTDKAAKLLGYQPRYEWKESRERTTRWLSSILPGNQGEQVR
uniref:3 beta-hydroxysteroid dehydrogenase type 7 isoform X1 n=1 Tax=Myxine glutinosa TaxID=7769 RepID=UPI00358F213F